MPLGKVRWLRVGKVVGKVGLIEETGGRFDLLQEFVIFLEPEDDIVDPTVMVKRSWMIQLLGKALAHDLPVFIHHLDGIVAYVELRPAAGGG